MKEIYLIRHGRQSSKLCNVDVSLDDAGRQQSHLVADRLASYGLEALYASGLKRAQETAQPISTWRTNFRDDRTFGKNSGSIS